MTTAFLHTQIRRSSGKEYRLLSPLFGMLAFVGVVFVSFIVRAGGLWMFSVHDYGTSSSTSAVSRLISLLGEDPSVAGTFAFLLILLLVSVAAVLLASRKMPKPEPVPDASRFADYINDRDVMLLTVSLISITSLVALILLVKNMDSGPAAVYSEFNQKMSVLFVALMVAMSICLAWRLVGNERALWLAVGIIGASVLLALASARFSWSDPLVAFSLPSYGVATLSSVARLAEAARRGGMWARLYGAGAQVVHLGVGLLLIAFVVSSNLQSYPSDGYEAAISVGGELEVGGYTLRLVSVEASDDVSEYPAEVAQVRTAVVEISEGARIIDRDATLRILYAYDSFNGFYVLETVPYVHSSVAGDLYVSFEWMSEDSVLMHAKTVPLMGLLWFGSAMLCVGLGVRMLAWRGRLESSAPSDLI
jgi:hypothetical protein